MITKESLKEKGSNRELGNQSHRKNPWLEEPWLDLVSKGKHGLLSSLGDRDNLYLSAVKEEKKSDLAKWHFPKDHEAYNTKNLDPIALEIENTFVELANQWRRETRGISSTNQASMHPAYQQIIGMGKEVIPLLLRELEQSSGRWFWALKAISREDPVPPEKRGHTKEMIRYWLEWGKQKGYKW